MHDHASRQPDLSTDISRLIREFPDGESRRRLAALRLVVAGFIKPARIARQIGICPRTIYYWINLLKYQGVEAVLARKRRSGRAPRVRGGALEELRAGLQTRRWKSARQIQEWLRQSYQVNLTLNGVYYWSAKLERNCEEDRCHANDVVR